MQDPTSTPPPVDARALAPRRSRSLAAFAVLIAFLLGAALAAWAASSGILTRLLPTAAPVMPATPRPAPPSAQAQSAQMTALGSVEGRLALVEDRLSRIDAQSRLASGNAARSEGLLIAYAARRLVDRGEPLGAVADQLRLRFSDAQPRAVQSVIDFAQAPVTVDQLSARLEALLPELAITGSDTSLWERARQQFVSLFVVRRDSSALLAPPARIARARLMLESGRIDKAIEEVRRLPGADAAETWITDARRYDDAHKALDLLETTAMLDPARLRDGAGQTVIQPSPLAPTAPMGEPTAEATGG